MKKVNALISIGKLEVQLQQHENLLKEVAELQKFIVENDYAKLAISIGRITELTKDSGIDVSENIKTISEFVFESFQSEHEIATTEEKLNMTLKDLNFSVRTHNCLERANICTVRQLASMSENDLLRVRNLGRRSIDEVIDKLESIGVKLGRTETEE